MLQRLLGISYRDRIINEEVKNRVINEIGPYTDLLAIVKQRKLRWYAHVTRSSGLSNTTLQGTVTGGRKGGRQKSGGKIASENEQAYS